MKEKKSNFRMWVLNIWIENTEEHLLFKESPYTMQEYWAKHRWWLKREYQYRLKRGLR